MPRRAKEVRVRVYRQEQCANGIETLAKMLQDGIISGKEIMDYSVRIIQYAREIMEIQVELEAEDRKR